MMPEKLKYNIDDYSTWDTEALLNHQMWLSDNLPDNPDYVDEIVKINNELEDRESR